MLQIYINDNSHWNKILRFGNAALDRFDNFKEDMDSSTAKVGKGEITRA